MGGYDGTKRFRNVERVVRWLVGLSMAFLVFGCGDPPNFTWPDKLPELPVVDVPDRTPYDAWKEWRLAQNSREMIVGAKVIDITPLREKGYWIAGYSANKPSRGAKGRITARILFFDDGRQSLAMVSCDVVGLMNDRIWNIRKRLSSTWGKDVLVTSTHNHAGPDTMGLWGRSLLLMIPVESGIEDGYLARVEQQIADGILEAAKSAVPADLYAARTMIHEQVSENAHKPGWKDDELTVMQARSRKDGHTIATMVNFGNHAEALGGDQDYMHPDFPGFLYPRLERREGGVAAFFNGVIGGIIVPALPRHLEHHNEIRYKYAKKFGEYLADRAAKAIRSGEKLNVRSIRVFRQAFTVPIDNPVFKSLATKVVLNQRAMNEEGRLYTEAWRIDFGELQVVTVPGEIFPSLGFAIKSRMQGNYRMILGLGADELGYIMTKEEYNDPLYAYEQSVSLGPQTGPILMGQVLGLLEEK